MGKWLNGAREIRAALAAAGAAQIAGQVPVAEAGLFALPYLQFSHILLYSNSGTGKLFEITVDDSGTISATEVK